MADNDSTPNRRVPPPWGLFRYAAGWLVTGAVAALAIGVLLRSDEDRVSLPPVRETDLEAAVRAAGCELREVRGSETFNPPVVGARLTAPMRGGIYEKPPHMDAIIAALRQGRIVMQYRRGVARTRIKQLQELQPAVPAATIVTVNESGMPYEVAATAWRRLLGCRRFTDRTLDAVRLFRGRYLGYGPDSRP